MNAANPTSAPNSLSYTSAVSQTPLIGETIGDLFDRIAATYPENDALVSVHQGIRWSYRELQQQVSRCARALMAIGVEKGDRVGIWSPNNAQWCVTQFATAKIGAVLVNINPAYRTPRTRIRAEPVRVPFSDRRRPVQELQLQRDAEQTGTRVGRRRAG